ncbi:hypothetical protein FRC03_004302 [Tulasnella sp. 419]|nr:hypothetical protein FRC02_002005 [Tulasnella sp. 418]KAG8962377.1 hypothetical protein FRC03_004302 [Tulasnella sp. 419]
MSRPSGRFTKRADEYRHTLEAARKQRLLPVQNWEKQWVTPHGAAPGSTYKVLKWVKTDKKQDFSDDEAAETDEQLAPMRDELEALAGAIQEIEELEAAEIGDGDGDSRAGSEGPPSRQTKEESAAPGISLHPPSPSVGKDTSALPSHEPSRSPDPRTETPSVNEMDVDSGRWNNQ